MTTLLSRPDGIDQAAQLHHRLIGLPGDFPWDGVVELEVIVEGNHDVPDGIVRTDTERRPKLREPLPVFALVRCVSDQLLFGGGVWQIPVRIPDPLAWLKTRGSEHTDPLGQSASALQNTKHIAGPIGLPDPLRTG